MTKKSTTLNTIADLAKYTMNLSEYALSIKWRLETRTDNELIDNTGETFNTEYNSETREFTDNMKGEITGRICSRDELISAQSTSYTLNERSNSYRSDTIWLGRELGEQIYAMWPQAPAWKGSSYMSLKATQFTLVGILKRMGQSDLTGQINARIAAEKLEKAKNDRNYQRRNAITQLQKSIETILDLIKRAPESDRAMITPIYENNIKSMSVTIAAIESQME